MLDNDKYKSEADVSESIDKLSNVYDQKANTEMRAMALSGQVSKDIISSEERIGKRLAENQYFKNKKTTSGIITRIAEQSILARNAYGSAFSFNDINKINSDFSDKLNGIKKEAKKIGLPDSMISDINDKSDYYANLNQIEFNNRTGRISATQDYNNFMQGVGAITISADGNFPNARGMISTSKSLLNNPYLTQGERVHVYNAMVNAENLNSLKGQNPQLSSNVDSHLSLSLSNENSIKGVNNIISGMFLNHEPVFSASNLNIASINPVDFNKLKENYINLDNIYKNISQSHNVIGSLNELSEQGGFGSKVSNILLPLISKGQADVVIRGLSRNVNEAYNNYLNAQDSQKHKAWINYSSQLSNAASTMGIPQRDIGTMPNNVSMAIKELDQDPSNPNYKYLLMDELHKFNQINQGSPINGHGRSADLAALYKYGPNTSPNFPSFVANMNPKLQEEIAKEFASAHSENINDIKQFISDSSKSLENISQITSVPYSVLQDTISATMKNFMNNGDSLSQASTKIKDIMAGYVSSSRYDVGSNYLLSKGTFSNLDIPKKYWDQTATRAINIAINNFVKDNTNKPKDIPEEAWHINRADKIGSLSNYTLMSSNGNFYAKNNSNDTLIPVNKTMILRAFNAAKGDIEEAKKDIPFYENSAITIAGAF